MAAEIRRGKKKKDRKKPQGKNIMVCPITYGDHNNTNNNNKATADEDLDM